MPWRPKFDAVELGVPISVVDSLAGADSEPRIKVGEAFTLGCEVGADAVFKPRFKGGSGEAFI